MTVTPTPAGASPAASDPASTPATVPPPPTTEQTPAPSAAEPAEQVKPETGKPSAERHDEGQGDNEEQPKPKSRWQDRVDRLTAQKHALNAENEALKAELARLRKPIQMPDRDLSFEEQEALRLRQVVREERADQLESELRQRQSREADLVSKAIHEKVQAAAERIPDITEKVFDPTLPISAFAAEFIAESERGAEVAYYLASNRTEAARIAAMPDTRQAVELARLEARLNAAPQVRKISQAPTPPPMVGGGQTAPVEKPPSEMSMAEYSEWYRKRNKRR